MTGIDLVLKLFITTLGSVYWGGSRPSTHFTILGWHSMADFLGILFLLQFLVLCMVMLRIILISIVLIILGRGAGLACSLLGD